MEVPTRSLTKSLNVCSSEKDCTWYSSVPVQCLELITKCEQPADIWVSFVLAGLWALSPMHWSLHTECFWNGFQVDCSVGFVTLLIISQERVPQCPCVDEMVGSVPAPPMEDLDMDKIQCKAEGAYLSSVLYFQNLCIRGVDSYFRPEALGFFFFFWNAVVDGYYF